MDKMKLRALGRRLREDGEKDGFGKKAFNKLLSIPEYEKAKLIMLYLSLEKEAPTDYILEEILSMGKRVCVPVTEGIIITPCEILKDDELIKGTFNVREPAVKRPIKNKDVDFSIVPGLVFDKSGRRCGYGKGCYDSFLERSDSVKVGLAFSSQIIDEVYTEAHDIKMDYIITEKEVINCGDAKKKK